MPNPKTGESFYWAVGSGRDYTLSSNPTRQGNLVESVKPNRAYTTVVQVRRDGIRCLLDGKELVNHKTDFRDLTCDGWRDIPDKRRLAVACDDPTVFHYVRVVEVTGTGKKPR